MNDVEGYEDLDQNIVKRSKMRKAIQKSEKQSLLS